MNKVTRDRGPQGGRVERHPRFKIERNNARIQARIPACRHQETRSRDTYKTREKSAHLYLFDF